MYERKEMTLNYNYRSVNFESTFKGFICTKNERKYFFISTLVYKKRSNKKNSVRVKIKSSN